MATSHFLRSWFPVLTLLALLLSPMQLSGQVARFSDVTAAKGLSSFTSSPGDGHGPGAIFTDLNNDGYADIYMMKSFGGANGMYLNSPGSGNQRTFVRAPNDAGTGDVGWSTGAISGDYDNDGDQDLFVLNFGSPNTLYKNQLVETGSFNFADVTSQTDPTSSTTDSQRGLSTAVHSGEMLNESLTAAWADPDRDGDLDLYVGNHHEYYGSPGLQPGEIAGQRDIFYQNNGDGTFSDMTMPLGLTGFETPGGAPGTSNQSYSSSNAVIFADFNNDRWPDLLVTNKVGGPDDRNMLYMNQGASASGQWEGFQNVTYDLPTTFGRRSGGAMGVDVGDIDNDGDLDFYITDWSNPNDYPNNGRNDLWINQLSETGQLDFVHSSELPALYSWGTQIEDFDNNGYVDVHVATDTNAADFLYLNSEQGFTGDVAASSGVGQNDNSRGDQAADYNRDGLLDLLVINPYDGPSALFENESDDVASDYHFLSLKLIGNPNLPGKFRSTRDAIGARLAVSADLDGDGSIQANEVLIREVVSGSSNAASTSSLDVEVGLGLATQATVEIVWPSGRRTTLQVDADRFLTVQELHADLDGDGDVDQADLDVWSVGFGLQSGASQFDGDADGDGDVDGVDFLHWQRGFGGEAVVASFAPTAIPEPSSFWLVWGAALWVFYRRRSTPDRGDYAAGAKHHLINPGE